MFPLCTLAVSESGDINSVNHGVETQKIRLLHSVKLIVKLRKEM